MCCYWIVTFRINVLITAKHTLCFCTISGSKVCKVWPKKVKEHYKMTQSLDFDRKIRYLCKCKSNCCIKLLICARKDYFRNQSDTVLWYGTYAECKGSYDVRCEVRSQMIAALTWSFGKYKIHLRCKKDICEVKMTSREQKQRLTERLQDVSGEHNHRTEIRPRCYPQTIFITHVNIIRKYNIDI